MSDVAKKCQYAGDPNDEYCKSCNGLTMLVNGVEYPCTECTAYTPVGECEDDKFVKMADGIEEEAPVEESSDASETAPEAETEAVKEETTDSTADNKESTTVETTDESKQSDVKVVASEQEKEETLLPDGVTVKSLRYMSGVTLIKTEKTGKETYYKFSAEEEWALSDEVGANTEAVNNAREALWDKLNLEIDSQIEALYGV